MSEPFTLLARWGPRQEDREHCAARVASFLRAIRDCDDVFRRWLTLGSPAQDVDLAPAALAPLLERNRRDTDGAVIDELGFALNVWNGREDDDGANVDILCGCYSAAVANYCVVELPFDGEVERRVLRVDTLTCLIRAAVASFEPEWASVVPVDRDDEEGGAAPPVGWLTYVRVGESQLPPLPEDVRADSLGADGTLLVLAEDLASASRPDQLERARSIRDALERALGAAVSGD